MMFMEGNSSRDFVLVIVMWAMIAFIGVVAAQGLDDSCILIKEEEKMAFEVDQHVSGVGFFSTYRYALMPDVLGTEGTLFNGVELKKKSCGSGTINTVSLFSGESTYYANTSHFFDKDAGEEAEILERRDEIEVIYEYEEEATSVVSLKEDSNMTHSPMAMVIGAKYYALHPITFRSLLSDETCVKNRDSFNSLNHEIKEAHGLNMALDAQSDATSTTINVDENLIDGKAHFGALQLPLGEVDTNYAGTYHIKNNMALTTSEYGREFEDAWLPCCFGGYLDMPINYQRGDMGFGSNVKAIFDCSCARVSGKE